jgi:hypothetical protein
MKVSAKTGWSSELICMYQQRQGDYQTLCMPQYTGRLSEMGASTSKDREPIRADVQAPAKRVVIRASMHVSAIQGNYQKWCA